MSFEELVKLMGLSAAEKVKNENNALFYKMVLFVSLNNILVGTIVYLVS